MRRCAGSWQAIVLVLPDDREIQPVQCREGPGRPHQRAAGRLPGRPALPDLTVTERPVSFAADIWFARRQPGSAGRGGGPRIARIFCSSPLRSDVFPQARHCCQSRAAPDWGGNRGRLWRSRWFRWIFRIRAPGAPRWSRLSRAGPVHRAEPGFLFKYWTEDQSQCIAGGVTPSPAPRGRSLSGHAHHPPARLWRDRHPRWCWT